MYPTIKRLTEAYVPSFPVMPNVIPEEAERWLERHAPQQWAALKSGKKPSIYRGVRSIESSADIITRPDYRPAANTGDLYKVVIDKANPDWPRRGYSTIASTNIHRAGTYGRELTVIIPPDDAVIAVCSEEDIWDSGLNSINNWVITSAYLILSQGFPQQSFERTAISPYVAFKFVHDQTPATEQSINDEITAWCNAVRDQIDSAPDGARDLIDNAPHFAHEHHRSIVRYLADRILQRHNTSLVDFLAAMPRHKYENHGFKKLSPLDAFPFNREVWFEGPHVRIVLMDGDK